MKYPLTVQVIQHRDTAGVTLEEANSNHCEPADDVLIVRLLRNDAESGMRALVGSFSGETASPLSFAQVLSIWLTLATYLVMMSVTDPKDRRLQQLIHYCALAFRRSENETPPKPDA